MNSELTLPTCEMEERRLLGVILEGSAQAYDITTQQGVTSADFFLQSHRLIFSALADMADAGEGIDLITAAAKLRDRGQLAQLGGEGIWPP